MAKSTVLICFGFSFLFYSFGLLIYTIPIFRMENPETFFNVQICTGNINYAQALARFSHQEKLVVLISRMFPILMLFWAVCNRFRVYSVKKRNSYGLRKFRYRWSFSSTITFKYLLFLWIQTQFCNIWSMFLLPCSHSCASPSHWELAQLLNQRFWSKSNILDISHHGSC